MNFLRPDELPATSGGQAKKARARQSGNVLIQVVFVIAILAGAVWFIADRIVTQKNVVLQTSTVLKVRFALHSVMDYMYFGIQKRYCFDDNLLPLSPGQCQLKTGVSGTTGKSIERVLLSQQQAVTISEMLCGDKIEMGLEWPKAFADGSASVAACKATVSPNAIRKVNKMEFLIPAKKISGSHTLAMIIDPLTKVLLKELKGSSLDIRVVLERDPSSPVAGTEIFFTVKVSFEMDGKVLAVNHAPLKLTSFGTMYPREVGTFALMLPGDLRLDGVSKNIGDVVIPTVDGPNGNPGITFMSPVFVNGRGQDDSGVHLPKAGATGHYGGGIRYSPVTFVERLVIGNGAIHEDGQPYKPDTAGGPKDTLWHDNRVFGGFKAGVLIDSFNDLGLLTFGGISPGLPADKSLMDACSTRQGVLQVADITRQSELYVTKIDQSFLASGKTYNYIMGLTKGDKFNRQNGAARGNVVTPGLLLEDNSSAVPLDGEAIMRVQGNLKGDGIDIFSSADLGNKNLVTFVPPAPGRDLAGVEKLQEAISALPDTDPDKAIKQAAYDAIKGKQARITVKLKPIGQRRAAAPAQEHLLELSIVVENEDALIDATGKPYKFSLDFGVFDLTYRGFLAADPQNTKIHRAMKFTGNGAIFPDPFSLEPAAFLSEFDHDTKIVGADAPALDLAYVASNYHASPADASAGYDDYNYLQLDADCAKMYNSSTGRSFGAVDWNFSFAGSVRSSWNFGADPEKDCTDTEVDPLTGKLRCKEKGGANNLYVVDEWRATSTNSKAVNGIIEAPLGSNNFIVPDREPFRPHSIVDRCVIEGGARLVSGFFTCNTLIIEARANDPANPGNKLPLTIVGTFIVRDLQIDPSALKAGVHWMSIYHPQAAAILRQAKILRRVSHKDHLPPDDCSDGVTTMPIWAKDAASLITQEDTRACNSLSLRNTADPFTWTAVDPDCGIVSAGDPTTKCKRHPVNFLIMEHGRGGGP